MHLSFQAITLLLASVATAVPAGSPAGNKLFAREDKRGFETVPGLGSRKQNILNAGGNTLDLAIAMLETVNMQTSYTYGKEVSFFAMSITKLTAIIQEMARLMTPPTLACSR
jgi:hypothetical protein